MRRLKTVWNLVILAFFFYSAAMWLGVFVPHAFAAELQVESESPTITVINDINGVRIEWEVKELTDFVIKISKKETGGEWYTLADGIDNGNGFYLDKKVHEGKTYNYKISYDLPDGNDVSSDVSTIVFLKKIKGLKISIISKDSLDISWKKQARADGYIICRLDENGEWKRIKKISSNKRLSYIDKGLKYKGTYAYVVRSYVKKNGKTYYGAYDEAGKTKTLNVTNSYKNGLKFYYDMDGNKLTNVEGIIGKKKSYLIKVNTKACVMTVYAKDAKGKYCVPVRSWLCSPSRYTSSGTWRTGEKYRFRALYFGVHSQWAERIHGCILFHTVPYKKYGKKDSLDVAEYNKLGTPASHGCVRLPCDAAKWIYDNCPVRTKVVIYRSDNPGPFGKPKRMRLPSWHTWDPTDPTCKKLCKKHGCTH